MCHAPTSIVQDFRGNFRGGSVCLMICFAPLLPMQGLAFDSGINAIPREGVDV